MVGGRFGCTSSSVLVPSSFFFSTPTFTFAKVRNVLRDWILEFELALIDQHHGGDAGDGFGHREQPEDRLIRHRLPGDDILHTDELMIDRLAVLLDQEDRTGDFAACDLLA